MKKYKKITKTDVFDMVMSITLDFMSPLKTINLVNIASLLKTSRYQVKKYMNELKKEGLVELKYDTIHLEDELPILYWGYGLTTKGKETELFINKKKEYTKLLSTTLLF